MIEWHGDKVDPQKFDADKVKFHNAKIRQKNMLAEID
jgi:hypothetical protein